MKLRAVDCIGTGCRYTPCSDIRNRTLIPYCTYADRTGCIGTCISISILIDRSVCGIDDRTRDCACAESYIVGIGICFGTLTKRHCALFSGLRPTAKGYGILGASGSTASKSGGILGASSSVTTNRCRILFISSSTCSYSQCIYTTSIGPVTHCCC